MKQTQVCIVGGGCVGLTLALGLAKANISVVVLDAASTQAPPTDEYGLRVSALSIASQTLLEQLNVWPKLLLSVHVHIPIWMFAMPTALVK